MSDTPHIISPGTEPDRRRLWIDTFVCCRTAWSMLGTNDAAKAADAALAAFDERFPQTPETVQFVSHPA